jgi:polygalacturonase
MLPLQKSLLGLGFVFLLFSILQATESFAPRSRRASNSLEQTSDSVAEVRQFGATGDGQTDDTAALQKALDSGHHTVRVPKGTYIIRRTLWIGSNTTLSLAPKAVIRLGNGAAAEAGGNCFMICNRDLEKGNENITIDGGIWDGNCAKNPRGEEFAPDSYGGVGISFMKVDHLTISNLTMRNNEAFAIRVGEVNRFLIENILLDHTVIRPNQDGVHVGGFSENGVIRNISAKRARVPNDDMIALNADDDVKRHFNRGMKLGPIRNILVENISAADAYTFVRLLSNTEPIRDITIRNIRGGCRYNCLNLHRWRFPKGRGNIKNVLVEDVEVAKLPGNNLPLIHVSLSVHNMRIRNFVRIDQKTGAKTLEIDNSIDADIFVDIRRASK